MAVSNCANAEVVVNARAAGCVIIGRRKTEAERVPVGPGRAAGDRVDVVKVSEPFKAILQIVITERILKTRVDFIAVAILVTIQIKAGSPEIVPLQ